MLCKRGGNLGEETLSARYPKWRLLVQFRTFRVQSWLVEVISYSFGIIFSARKLNHTLKLSTHAVWKPKMKVTQVTHRSPHLVVRNLLGWGSPQQPSSYKDSQGSIEKQRVVTKRRRPPYPSLLAAEVAGKGPLFYCLNMFVYRV